MESIDVEAKVISYLNAAGLPAIAYADVPASRPESFITVERVGGNRDNYVFDRPMIAVQCWAESRRKAAALAYRVDDVLPGIDQQPGVNSCRRNSLYNFPAADSPRYQATYDLVTTY